MTIDATIESFDNSAQDAFKQALAASLGNVTTEMIQLIITEGSLIVTAEIFAATPEVQTSVLEEIEVLLADPQIAAATLSTTAHPVTVQAVAKPTVVTVASPPPPSSPPRATTSARGLSPGGTAALTISLVLVAVAAVMVGSSLFTRRMRARGDEPPQAVAKLAEAADRLHAGFNEHVTPRARAIAQAAAQRGAEWSAAARRKMPGTSSPSTTGAAARATTLSNIKVEVQMGSVEAPRQAAEQPAASADETDSSSSKGESDELPPLGRSFHAAI